jgi:hypothetical protein
MNRIGTELSRNYTSHFILIDVQSTCLYTATPARRTEDDAFPSVRGNRRVVMPELGPFDIGGRKGKSWCALKKDNLRYADLE